MSPARLERWKIRLLPSRANRTPCLEHVTPILEVHFSPRRLDRHFRNLFSIAPCPATWSSALSHRKSTHPEHSAQTMSVAVIQGGGGAIGSHFARHLLKNTNLSIVATSRDPSAAKRAILGEDGKIDGSRLKVLEMDAKHESTIKKAAEDVKKEFGERSLRLLINASGVVSLLPKLTTHGRIGLTKKRRRSSTPTNPSQRSTPSNSSNPSKYASFTTHLLYFARSRLTRVSFVAQHFRPPPHVQALLPSPPEKERPQIFLGQLCFGGSCEGICSTWTRCSSEFDS